MYLLTKSYVKALILMYNAFLRTVLLLLLLLLLLSLLSFLSTSKGRRLS